MPKTTLHQLPLRCGGDDLCRLYQTTVLLRQPKDSSGEVDNNDQVLGTFGCIQPEDSHHQRMIHNRGAVIVMARVLSTAIVQRGNEGIMVSGSLKGNYQQ